MSRDVLVALVFSCIAGFAALTRPPSYDEVFWLSIARRWFGAGDIPYFDTADNKGPLLYTLFGIVDSVIPNMRVVFVAIFSLTIALLAVGVSRVLRSEAPDLPGRYAIVMLTVLSVASLSGWAITVELLAATALVWAVACRTSHARLGLLVVSMLFDIRASVLALALGISWRRTRKLRRSHLWLLSGLIGVGLLIALVVPELRFSLIEGPRGNRSALTPAALALAPVGLLPLLVVRASFKVHRVQTWVRWYLSLGVAIGIGSILAFPHYWVYCAVGACLLPVGAARFGGLATWVLSTFAIVVLALVARPYVEVDRAYWAAVEPERSAIDVLIRESDKVAVWSTLPHLHVAFADQTVDLAPSSIYWVWDLPDRSGLLVDYETRLHDANVLIVEGTLDPERVSPQALPAQSLVVQTIAGYECSETIGRVTVYREVCG